MKFLDGKMESLCFYFLVESGTRHLRHKLLFIFIVYCKIIERSNAQARGTLEQLKTVLTFRPCRSDYCVKLFLALPTSSPVPLLPLFLTCNTTRVSGVSSERSSTARRPAWCGAVSGSYYLLV